MVDKLRTEAAPAGPGPRVSRKALLANERFLQRFRKSRQWKEEAERRLNLQIGGWHVEPTVARPFAHFVYEPAAPADAPEERLTDDQADFYAMVAAMFDKGEQASGVPVERPDENIDMRTTTREAALIGDKVVSLHQGGVFTQFHKVAMQQPFQVYDRVDYCERRKQRLLESQIDQGVGLAE